MANTESILKMIRGEQRGVVAWLVCSVLSVLTPIYRLVIAIRNARFDRAEKQIEIQLQNKASSKLGNSIIRVAPIPVISIGNLTAGGTGKTPFVIYITKLLVSRSLQVAIVSRGYGARNESGSSRKNDEAMELEFRLPEVPHLQSADRFAGVQRAVQEMGSQIAVLDDGFQHRRLHRDLDIVLIDCTNPFGYNRLLPRGLLREPKSSLRRADAIVLTRTEQVAVAEQQALIDEIRKYNPQAVISAVKTEPSGWLLAGQGECSLDELKNVPVFAFCAIGNPHNFLVTLRQLNVNVVKHRPFPDHHHFSQTELEQIADEAQKSGARAIVCTHKDLVKVSSSHIGELPLYALQVDTKFVFNEQGVVDLVDQMILA